MLLPAAPGSRPTLHTLLSCPKRGIRLCPNKRCVAAGSFTNTVTSVSSLTMLADTLFETVKCVSKPS